MLTTALEQIELGVVVERRRVEGLWRDTVWRPVAVLAGEPAARPWTCIATAEASGTFYAGPATIELHRADAGGYHDNLASGAPRLWVVLRAAGGADTIRVLLVSADPATGEALTGAGNDIVDSVPMPGLVAARLAEFIARHHKPQPQYQRTRGDAQVPKGLP